MVAIENKTYVMGDGTQPGESTSNLNETFIITKK
jgi:hypothetical protein